MSGGSSNLRRDQLPPTSGPKVEMSPISLAATGDGVRSAVSRLSASTTRSSSSATHGWAGGRPSISSNTSTTQPSPPWSSDHNRRGVGAMDGSRDATRISRRWNVGATGLGTLHTALAKTRRPDAVISRAARPGENPPRMVVAAATGSASQLSIAARICSGSCSQSIRRPSARGSDVDMSTLPFM